MSTIAPRPAGGSHASDTDPWRYGCRYVPRTAEDGTIEYEQVPLTQEDLLYPQEGDHVVNTPNHHEDVYYLESVLRTHLAGQPGKVLLHDCRVDFSVEGVQPLGPDLLLLDNMPAGWDPARGTQVLGELGARPLLAIEATSPSTRRGDVRDKVDLYYRARIPFYAIIDERVTEQGREVVLVGYRAGADRYEPVSLNERGWLWLEPVGLWVAGEAGRAVCYDEQGNRCAGPVEAVEAARAAVAQADAQTEVVRARAEAAQARAEAAQAQADAERARAEAERARADTFQARLQEVEEELRRQRGS